MFLIYITNICRHYYRSVIFYISVVCYYYFHHDSNIRNVFFKPVRYHELVSETFVQRKASNGSYNGSFIINNIIYCNYS